MAYLTTPEQIDTFRAKVILQAIKLYLNTGMQVNRMYTPANMKRVVSEYTGKAYPRSRKGLEQAYNDLLAVVAYWDTPAKQEELERTYNNLIDNLAP